MQLKDLLCISGKAGIFKLKSQTKNHLVVESLDTGRKMPVFAAHKISALDDISIYTYSDAVPLSEVFDMIHEKENGEATIDPSKSEDELRLYMTEVMPEYDEDRVHVGDLKKLFAWYNLLLEKKTYSSSMRRKEKKRAPRKRLSKTTNTL